MDNLLSVLFLFMEGVHKPHPRALLRAIPLPEAEREFYVVLVWGVLLAKLSRVFGSGCIQKPHPRALLRAIPLPEAEREFGTNW